MTLLLKLGVANLQYFLSKKMQYCTADSSIIRLSPVQFLRLSSGWQCCFNPVAPPGSVHVLNVCVQSECPAFYKLQAMELITRSRVLQEAWVARKYKKPSSLNHVLKKSEYYLILYY